MSGGNIDTVMIERVNTVLQFLWDQASTKGLIEWDFKNRTEQNKDFKISILHITKQSQNQQNMCL